MLGCGDCDAGVAEETVAGKEFSGVDLYLFCLLLF